MDIAPGPPIATANIRVPISGEGNNAVSNPSHGDGAMTLGNRTLTLPDSEPGHHAGGNHEKDAAGNVEEPLFHVRLPRGDQDHRPPVRLGDTVPADSVRNCLLPHGGRPAMRWFLRSQDGPANASRAVVIPRNRVDPLGTDVSRAHLRTRQAPRRALGGTNPDRSRDNGRGPAGSSRTFRAGSPP
jgi:hypothetical protein